MMPPALPENNDLAGHAGDIQLLHVDEHLLVLDKPAGLLSVPGRGDDKQDCLSARVQQQYPEALVVHRLDQATSGLIVIARNAAVQRAMGTLFENRAVHKRYVAVVHGHMTATASDDAWSLIDLPIAADWPRRPLRVIDSVHGKPSQTRWKTEAFDAAASTTRVALEPLTGRTHQLRVHLQAIGHPILGDRLYGSDRVQDESARLLLHASLLGFRHPASGEILRFESAAPF